MPDIARPVVDLVEKFGFQWEYDSEYLLPDLAHRLQIREDKHYAPASMVAVVRAAMKLGEKLPPIIVTVDGHIVDGNTRVTAALRNKFPTIRAIVLSVKYEGASDPEMRRLRGLGAAANARHGKGINREELRWAVDHMGTDPKYTGTQIAALIGTTDATVQNLLAEKKAKDRATNLGLHVNGSVNATKLRTLGRQSDYLNDEPFKELFSLVEDTGISDKEIRELVQKARETKSDEGALDVIAHERQVRKDQIAEYKASGKSVPPAAAKLRQRLGFILGYEQNPRELIEHNPQVAEEYTVMIRKSIKVLEEAMKAQGV
jgi:hypothetical protein